MSVSSILVVFAEIKLAYRKILRPLIAWSAERARKREARRHGGGPTVPPLVLAMVLAGMLGAGCARWDHGMIWLDDTLPAGGSGEEKSFTTKDTKGTKAEKSFTTKGTKGTKGERAL